MNREEADSIVGQSVTAWTAANGIYVGLLESVQAIKGRPWRGTVRVTGVLEIAQHFERGHVVRRGFRPGETLEVGGSNIKLAAPQQVGSDYLAALERAQRYAERVLADTTRVIAHPGMWEGTLQALQCARAAETERLKHGAWNLKSSISVPSPAASPRLRPR